MAKTPPKKSAKPIKKTAPMARKAPPVAKKKAAPFGGKKPKIPALGGAGLMGLGGTGAQGMLP